MLDKLTGRTGIMEKALDAAWLRNEVIDANLANSDTPGYKRKVVAFEEYLNDAMKTSTIKGFKTDERHIPIGKKDFGEVDTKVTEDNSSTSVRLDGNNVDVEVEMAAMAKNTIKYVTISQSLSDELRRLKTVINDGR
jgi:flagellar basal-body rod protein FlgB